LPTSKAAADFARKLLKYMNTTAVFKESMLKKT